MTCVRQLGYLGLEVSDLAAWEKYAVDMLGLQLADRDDDGTLRLRMDAYAQRIAVHPGPADDLRYLGFEVAGEAELHALGQRLTDDGFSVTDGASEDAAARRVSRLICVEDPSGIPIELYCGAAISREPFRSGAGVSRFVTGDEGLGHVVICAKDAAATERFYVELLGLRVSDRVRIAMTNGGVIEITFLHANARHHSVGFMSIPIPKRLHHFMLEVGSEDDVGRTRDRAIDAGAAIPMDLGKHPNDRMLSFYSKSPSGFDVEVGAGGVKVDDATWRTHTYDHASLWGHKPRASA